MQGTYTLEQLAKLLNKLRTERGLSLAAAGDMIGVHRQAVHQAESMSKDDGRGLKTALRLIPLLSGLEISGPLYRLGNQQELFEQIDIEKAA